jgi:hypothetical protein
MLEQSLSQELLDIPDTNTGLPPLTGKYKKWIYLKQRSFLKQYIPKNKKIPNYHEYYNSSSWPKFAQLIRENRLMKEKINHIIADRSYIEPELFNIEHIQDQFKQHLSGKTSYYPFLATLLTFGLWNKKYGFTDFEELI